MKVLLLNTVKGIGKKNDIKEVNEGYARNFLFPKGLAKVATDQVIQTLNIQKSTKETQHAVQKNLLLKNLKELEGKTVVLKEKANATGSLFSSINQTVIAEALFKQHDITIDPQSIILPKPIKQCGTYEITVEVLGHKGVCTLVIEAKK
jgi:large subunit ribosomal protein L9